MVENRKSMFGITPRTWPKFCLIKITKKKNQKML
uniref:Uncharacterized protein n=1 Tax=Rhizophora mucronata TaxID=61149 RepID=A0A2P2NAP8_RHIMU